MKEFNLSQELQLTGNPLVSERTINKIKEFIKKLKEITFKNTLAWSKINEEIDKLTGDLK